MKRKTYNIAIAGLGNIGSYLFNYLIKNKKFISNKNNTNFNLRYVSAKNKNKKRNIKVKKNQWLKNYLDATKMKEIDFRLGSRFVSCSRLGLPLMNSWSSPRRLMQRVRPGAPIKTSTSWSTKTLTALRTTPCFRPSPSLALVSTWCQGSL